MENGSNEGTILNQRKEEKLKCEILKLQAEAINLDAKTLRIKNDSKFFSRGLFLKAILVIILFCPIIWFYYYEIFLPIMQKENIELGLKNAENEKKIADSKKELEQKEIIHQEKVNQLEIERKEAESKHAKIDQAYKKLFDNHGKLREDYSEIAHRLEKSKIGRETIESEKNKLLLRLESYERKLSILSAFYKAYSAITSSINLYIAPEFKYEGKKDLSPEKESYITLMPNLLKAKFAYDIPNIVTVMEKTEEWLADESVIQQFPVEDRKDLKRKANYKVTGAILKFKENSFFARFELADLSKDGTEKFIVSFIQQMPIEYDEIPIFEYGNFSIVRDRILKYLLKNQLRKYS